MTVKATNANDLLCLSQALSLAVSNFEFGRPYAKAIFTEYLRVSGFDVSKKLITGSTSVSTIPLENIKVEKTK